MKNPKDADFSLKKVKLIPGGGLQVVYKVSTDIDGSTYEKEEVTKDTRMPHPDLTKPIDSLLTFLAKTLRFEESLTVVRSKDFAATPKQLKAAEKANKQLLDQMDVTGFALSGKDDNLAVIVTGKLITELKTVVALNSPRIKFNNTTYGFEDVLEDKVDLIKSEVYKYLFDGKKSQLDMFNGTPESGEEKPSGKDAAAGDN